MNNYESKGARIARYLLGTIFTVFPTRMNNGS